jgi:hypothetical protein
LLRRGAKERLFPNFFFSTLVTNLSLLLLLLLLLSPGCIDASIALFEVEQPISKLCGSSLLQFCCFDSESATQF